MREKNPPAQSSAASKEASAGKRKLRASLQFLHLDEVSGIVRRPSRAVFHLVLTTTCYHVPQITKPRHRMDKKRRQDHTLKSGELGSESQPSNPRPGASRHCLTPVFAGKETCSLGKAGGGSMGKMQAVVSDLGSPRTLRTNPCCAQKQPLGTATPNTHTHSEACPASPCSSARPPAHATPTKTLPHETSLWERKHGEKATAGETVRRSRKNPFLAVSLKSNFSPRSDYDFVTWQVWVWFCFVTFQRLGLFLCEMETLILPHST